ncbi:MFS transporter [Marivibrio halodurans]|uniref:MFS transporter n=1 Tax=Marivibrio halodurans TaxID=2039722 RepID=A0A8J7S681_9PROT|nr:MFS transporter [Marivibrio halodurans]MBP5856342.1 MFS transporter [Marivibrio halodurans]
MTQSAPSERPSLLRRPETMLVIMACAMAVSMNGWMALLNNFAVERAAFTGKEIGFLQSIREIPGFLSFAAIFLLPFIREQNLAFVSLALLGIGTALTGYFPSELLFYGTTFIMSVGYHYYETMNQSLTLQLVEKRHAAQHLSKQLMAASAGTLAVFIVIMLTFDDKPLTLLGDLIGISTDGWGLSLGYEPLYVGAGLFTLAIAVFCKIYFPRFEAPEMQTKSLFLRRRYWLYYALTFMGGARRQIFMVFAAFLMVEKFGYDVSAITLLYMINLIANIFVAPYVGRLIARLGERAALIFEYCGLIGIFAGYAIVEDQYWAAGLYILDHLFFAFAIAIKTYFQKIADPKDIASTAGVSFTINHIAAVGIPAAFGFIWLNDPGLVFYIGSAMACVSLILALMVPRHPDQGNETLVRRLDGPRPAPTPAE